MLRLGEAVKGAPGIDEVMTALLLLQEKRSGLWSLAGRGVERGR